MHRLATTLPLLLVGCGVPARVTSQAAADLGCPSARFEQVTDDSWEGHGTTHRCTRYVVTGCGRFATVDDFRSDGWGEGSVQVYEGQRPSDLVPCGAIR